MGEQGNSIERRIKSKKVLSTGLLLLVALIVLSDTVYAYRDTAIERYRTFTLLGGIIGFLIVTVVTWKWYRKTKEKIFGFYGIAVTLQFLMMLLEALFQPSGLSTLELYRNGLELMSAICFTWGTWTIFRRM